MTPLLRILSLRIEKAAYAAFFPTWYSNDYILTIDKKERNGVQDIV